MSRSTWAIYIKTAGSWVLEGTGLNKPNDDFPTGKNSTQIQLPLTDGSLAFITPSTKYLDNMLTFIWYWDDGTTKTKVETYITNQSDIKIIDDLSNEFFGRFISISVVRVVGQSDEKYDIESKFVIMPGLE